ncbi:MAG TPA: SusD/RagB family nutrient-binding outer membrane lipoprotein [Bacteroidales bacterium]|nr:SusD/RagB family nutrient-binding outer membrane lipoprotein [Bacteroidales bacterium]
MKPIKLKYFSLFWFIALIMFVAGCNDFGDMNDDPSQSTDMDPNMQLSTVQLQVSSNKWQQNRLFIYPGAFTYHISGSWADVEYGGKGKKNDGYMSNLWSYEYPVQIKNIVDLVERTNSKPEYTNLNAVARIMKVYLFSRLTDMFGDIPYFDAGKGYYTGTFLPKYDTQKDIYYDFFKELDAAAKALGTASDKVIYDIYYNGDLAKWKKFANSMRLRLAMHIVKVEPEKARAEAEAAIAGGVMENNADMCVTKHLNSPYDGTDWGRGGNGNSYIFMESGTNSNGYRVSQELVKFMEDRNDPRLPLMVGCYLEDPSRTDITQALLNALKVKWQDIAVPACYFTYDIWRADINLNIGGVEYKKIPSRLQQLQPSKYICAFDAPYFHQTCAEVKLFVAEAAFRGWNTGGKSVNESYAEAMNAAMKQMSLYPGAPEITQTQIDNYIAANPMIAGQELEQINTHLWAVLFLNEIEAYTNLRRSGYPAFTWKDLYPAESESNHQMPRRYQYPLNEQFKNKDNYNEAVARMGGTDSWLNRVWWDKQ